MMTREQARELSKNMEGTITLNEAPIYVENFPSRTEITGLNADRDQKSQKAWEADDPWGFTWKTTRFYNVINRNGDLWQSS
jgi:hypothetical protein